MIPPLGVKTFGESEFGIYEAKKRGWPPPVVLVASKLPLGPDCPGGPSIPGIPRGPAFPIGPGSPTGPDGPEFIRILYRVEQEVHFFGIRKFIFLKMTR